MTDPRATGLATPVDLGSTRRTSDDRLAASLHPAYRGAVGRLPAGSTIFRGLPFAFADAGGSARWLLLDGPAEIDLSEACRDGVTHLVIAHFVDALRDNTPFETAPQDNLETLRLVEDCYRLAGWEALR